MGKIINIGKKDYNFEFTIEASLYDECIEKITSLMMSVEELQSNDAIKETIVNGFVNIPKTALTVFYAGLMENHGDEITSIDDAKKLAKVYMQEHKEDGKGNFYEILQLMMEVMEIDGFFEQIGLSQAVQQEMENPKKPQDHKKKTTKTKVTEM